MVNTTLTKNPNHLMVVWADQDGQHSRSFFCYTEEQKDEANLFCLRVQGTIKLAEDPNF